MLKKFKDLLKTKAFWAYIASLVASFLAGNQSPDVVKAVSESLQ